MYLSHVAAEKYKMPELKVSIPEADLNNSSSSSSSSGGGGGGGRGRTAASSAILSQMSRIEQVIGAMSRRISNIEKALLTSNSSPPSTASTPSSTTTTTPSTPSTSSRSGPRRTPGSRASSAKNKIKNTTPRKSGYKKHQDADGKEYFESMEGPSAGATVWKLPTDGEVVQ